MCIYLAAALLTHLGAVPGNKSHRASHCLFLGRSYISGELLPALLSQAGSPDCRATTGFVCWDEGRIVLPVPEVGATTAFSQLCQRTPGFGFFHLSGKVKNRGNVFKAGTT